MGVGSKYDFFIPSGIFFYCPKICQLYLKHVCNISPSEFCTNLAHFLIFIIIGNLLHL